MKHLIIACAMLPALLAPAVAQTVNDPTQQPPAPFPGGTLTLSPAQLVYNCSTLVDLLDIIESPSNAAALQQIDAKNAPGKDGLASCSYLGDAVTGEAAMVQELYGMVMVKQYPPFPDGIGGEVTVAAYQGFDVNQLPFFVALGHPSVAGDKANFVFDYIARINP